MKCLMCGEEYTRQDIKELREMGEQFHHDRNCFICPDCYDYYSHLSLEEQLKLLFYIVVKQGRKAPP